MESFADLFNLVLERCKAKISEVAFKVWLKDIIPVSLEDSTACLKVNSEFKMKILQ